MEVLFIWFYSNPNTLPKGVPATVMTTITEEFYPKIQLKSNVENGLNTLLCISLFLLKRNTNCLKN